MAKKKKQQNTEIKRHVPDYRAFSRESQPGETELVPLTDTLKDNYMPYAMSVIVSRAIPGIDGFKPSQRKVLYTMYRMGLMDKDRAKCADIVGQTMALNPHGDQTIYETMVRMTRGNEALLVPWIDSKGNMGKVYSRDMQYAAYRYTEAKLAPACEIFFQGLKKNAVDMVDNYSGTLQEPILLPAAVPTVLINANQGIAVGMASNICSFNLREVCAATRLLLEAEDADLLAVMPAPDFSTGGTIIYDAAAMQEIYETGRGSFKVQAVTEIDYRHKRIEVREIPYTTSIEAIIQEVNKNIKNGKISEIVDVRDETDLNGLRITFDLKKNADCDLVLKKLLRFTPLVSNFACNFNVLLEGVPQVLGVRDILLAWLDWRRSCLLRELTFDRDKLQDKLHLLRALESVLLDIDRAIQIIRRTDKEADVVPHLMAAFSLDQTQAEYVADIKLRHLNREYLLQRTRDISALEDQIHDLEAILQSRARLDRLIGEQLKFYADQYGQERKSTLLAAEKVKPLKIETKIDDYNLKLFFTKEGYLKKLPLTSLRSAGDLYLKEDDEIIQSYETTNLAEIFFFSDRGNVYKLFAYELEDTKPSLLGEFVPNILSLEKGEKILFIYATVDYQGYLLLTFADGKAVKVSVAAYATKNNRKKLVHAIYSDAELCGLWAIPDQTGNGDMAILSSQGRMIVVDSDLIPYKKTKHSQGKQIMTCQADYRVTRSRPLAPDEAENLSYYRVRTLPAAGRYIKDDLLRQQQVEFDV